MIQKVERRQWALFQSLAPERMSAFLSQLPTSWERSLSTGTR
jgi:hypothetical protein